MCVQCQGKLTALACCQSWKNTSEASAASGRISSRGVARLLAPQPCQPGPAVASESSPFAYRLVLPMQLQVNVQVTKRSRVHSPCGPALLLCKCLSHFLFKAMTPSSNRSSRSEPLSSSAPPPGKNKYHHWCNWKIIKKAWVFFK